MARAGVLLPLLALLSAAISSVFVLDMWRATMLPSGCEMTYSWPVYTPLTWSKATHHKYALYSVHMHARREELTGVPVLFLPGHLGSYKQARSIARHLFDANATLFDVFALDFRGELTAVSGDFVAQQAQYVNTAIRAILRQYKKQQLSSLKKKSKGKRVAKPVTRVPESVVIVAHSMGGVVARVAATLPSYVPKSIQHVVSLGSPHDHPAFPFDADMQRVYAMIATDAHAQLEDDDDTSASVVVSIAGGHKDTLVHTSLSVTDRVAHADRTIAALTTAMPGVALTMDHLCLLWCHQLLDRVAKSIVAVVDADTAALVQSATARVAAARDVLLRATEADDVTAATVLQHKAHVRSGYATDELATYNLVTPALLFQILRTRLTTLFVIMYALALHILSLQVAHWQRAFALTPDARAASQPSQQPKFPSFTSMLHPSAHVPLFVSQTIALVTGASDSDVTRTTRQTTVVAALVAAGVGAAALFIETARSDAAFAAQYSVVLELLVLYPYAIGLLYTLAVVLSALRAVVVSPLVSLLAPRVKKTPRWTIISAIFALVFALGHVQTVVPFEMVAAVDASRNLALLVLASVAVFLVYLAALAGNVSTTGDQQRMQRSLFALYALSLTPWAGKIVSLMDVVQSPPPEASTMFTLECIAYVVVLAVARYVATCSQEWMLPMPPTAFFGAATGQDAGAQYDSDVRSASSSSGAEHKVTAETCPKCVFEDGGPGAILVEYTNEHTQRIKCSSGDVVFMGPTFRVVACDCVVRFERPREYCAFCTRACRLCGGGAGNVQQALKYNDFLNETQTASAVHALVPLLMEALAVAQLAVGLRREHLPFYLTPLVSLALVVYHVLLLTDVEAKRRKNKLNKAKKKKRKSKTKTASTASASAAKASSSTTTSSSTASKPTAKSTPSADTTKKTSSNKKKQAARPPNPNVPESLFVNPIYEMVDDDDE